jgi:hypothetical protein
MANNMAEEIVAIVKCFSLGKEPDSTVVVVPKQLGAKKGQRFLVKRDLANRIIYEPIEELNQK